MKTFESPLAAKVAAFNFVHAQAQKAEKQLKDSLRPFVGQKVCKVDGTLLEKVKKAMPEIAAMQINTGDIHLHAFRTTGHGYSIRVEFQADTQSQKGCHRQECSLYLADLSDGILTKIYDDTTWPQPITVEQLTEARRELIKAKEVVGKWNSALCGLGEHDSF